MNVGYLEPKIWSVYQSYYRVVFVLEIYCNNVSNIWTLSEWCQLFERNGLYRMCFKFY